MHIFVGHPCRIFDICGIPILRGVVGILKRLLHRILELDVGLFFLALNATNKREVRNLRKVRKRIRTLGRVKVVHIHDAVFHRITNHIIAKGILSKVGFM